MSADLFGRPPITALVPRGTTSVACIDDDSVYIPTSYAANFIPLSPKQIKRKALAGAYGAHKIGLSGKNPNSVLIAVERMPRESRILYYQRHPEHARCERNDTSVVAVDAPSPVRSFDAADTNARLKAAERAAWLEAYGKRPARMTDEQFVAQYKSEHPDVKLSVDTLKRWLPKYDPRNWDRLVDANDGRGARDRSIVPEPVLAFFLGHLTSGDAEPNIADSIRDTRVWAESKGIRLDASDATFYYHARTKIPDVVWRATREHQDDDSKVLATIRRDYNFPALKIVQADHHISDVFVRCTDGHMWVKSGDRLVSVGIPGICEGECKHGHRVWLTVFIDVASRAILAWVASLTYPNAETIRQGVRMVIERFGIFEALYIDNGKDFQSAFGRAIRHGNAAPLNEPFVSSLITALKIRVIYALPYRGRSKVIERLFRTWVEQLWKGSHAYVGQLGKRRKRVDALYHSVGELPSYDDFVRLLTVKVDLYNMQPGHRGQNMRGRSPLAVLASTRIPVIKPEPVGFAIAFWIWFGRQVQNGGAVSVTLDRYCIPSDVYAKLPRGKTFVQLLVDPADIRHAIVLTGCEHTKSSVSREKGFGCGCAGKGTFLCVAPMWNLSQYDSDEAITAENYRLLGEYNKDLMQRVRAHNSPAVRQELQHFRVNRLALYTQLRDRLGIENRELIRQALGSDTAATAQMLPQSSLGRMARRYQELNPRRDGLTDQQHELADAALTQRQLDAGRPQLIALPPVADRNDEQLMHSREVRGFCLFDTVCPNARERGSSYCNDHNKELGDE